MKQHIIYECEKCGKQSKDREEIMICEAAHFGLTVAEKQEWEQLKEKVRHKSAIVSNCKNEQTDKEFDDAIAELIEFEKLHGIEENYLDATPESTDSQSIRSRWIIDKDIPIFKGDGREYIEQSVNVGE